ncbi:hypothetical protein HII31_05567 [Pseudocercospora fuligena]|uniref:Cytochrome b561 domain-containing protein n=1 Tax=Pseudocercospora fuligena TaxID=685502 RepID=A0A8H6RLN5_9PEZI|nr:hypothetical protein HII31_05567 [Pseudocercospora fuligena]
MADSGLSAPGTSVYDSNTMYVGDGTWDSERNTFLLPNLVGLNFDTMRYNGMGNRFRGLPQYHRLIIGHGVVAAITFMAIVPAAIFFARFYHAEGRFAYKAHVYLQIIAVFLATVVFILGFFAVGPERSLSNPHHGIGVAIYVSILVQFIYGWWWSRRERKRTRPHPTIPLKVHIHRLFGRAIAVLAFIQIALGLTLYGSPKVLFILYALWGALLLFLYLTLEYRDKGRSAGIAPSAARSDYYSDYTGSYLSGDQTQLTQDRRSRRRSGSHWARNALAGAGLFGAYEWWKRRGKRKDQTEGSVSDYQESTSRLHSRPPGTPGRPASSVGPPGPRPYTPYGPGPPSTGPQRYDTPSRPPPPAFYTPGQRPTPQDRHRRHDETVMSPQTWEHESEMDEKWDDRPPQRSTWRDRIVGAGAGIAAFQGVKSLFGSKKRRKDDYAESDVSYQPGQHSMVSQTDVSRVEAGQAPFSPNDPRRNQRPFRSDMTPATPTRPGRRTSQSSLSYDDEYSNMGPRPVSGEGPSLRDSIATMGAIAGFREWNKRRKDRNERQRLDRIRQQELESEEQYNRRNSNRYPRPQDASGRRQSLSGTILTGPDPALGSNPELSRTNFRPDINQPPLPAAAGAIHMSPSHPPASTAGPSAIPPNVMEQHQHQTQTFNLPPPPPGPPPPDALRPAGYLPPEPGSLQMPQGMVNPDPSRLTSEHQSQSQFQDGTQFAANEAAAAAAGLAASQRTQSLSPSRRGGRRDSRSRIPGARRGSTSASISQLDSAGPPPVGGVPENSQSPPVSVKMKVHPDGRHVTLRRLNEEEAAAERAARRRERRSRRASSLTSSADEAVAGSSRYRRNNGGQMRDSSQQPIAAVPPPPPAMSSSVGRRDSELNLPPGRIPQASSAGGSAQAALPAAAGPAGSGAVGSPGTIGGGTDLGTGTDVSAFADNRRRRRAERARKLEASRQGGNRVEFE